MTSIWTGERVRLRATEPEDWATFMRFDQHSADVRAAGVRILRDTSFTWQS